MNKDQVIQIAKFWLRPVAIIVFSSILIGFLAGRISDLSKSIQEKRTASAILQKRVETIGNIQTDLKKIGDSNYEKLTAIIPTTDDVAAIRSNIEKLAKDSNISINHSFSSNPTPTSYDIKDQDYSLSSIDYSANLAGSITGLVRFLKRLEKTNYLLTLDSVAITSPSEGWFSSSTASIKGKLYLKKPIR